MTNNQEAEKLEAMAADFEAWWAAEHDGEVPSRNVVGYLDDDVDDSWMGWCAGIAAEQRKAAEGHLAAQKRKGDAWCDASIPPDVPEGKDAYFWIAMRRKYSDKVVTLPAVYANAYPLCSEERDDAHGAHWSQVAVEYDEVGADILATGWYDIKVGEGDYDQEYQPVCSEGDVILAWCRAPEFVLATQTPSPDQDREVSP